MGAREAAVLPDLRPSRGAGRGADARGHEHRRDERRRRARSKPGCASSPRRRIVTSYVGQGAPRFFFAISPELPDSVLRQDRRPDAGRRGARGSQAPAARGRSPTGLAPGSAICAYPARVRPLLAASRSPSASWARTPGRCADRRAGPRRHAAQPDVRQVNHDWGKRAPTARFVLDQDRLRPIGLISGRGGAAASVPAQRCDRSTQVREDIRTVDVVARSAGGERLDPARLGDLTLTSRDGQPIPLDQIGHVEVRMEDPILQRAATACRRSPCAATSTRRCSRRTCPTQVIAALQPLMAALPAGYRIEMGGSHRGGGQGEHRARRGLPAHVRPDAGRHHPPGPLASRRCSW